MADEVKDALAPKFHPEITCGFYWQHEVDERIAAIEAKLRETEKAFVGACLIADVVPTRMLQWARAKLQKEVNG